ncbi:MAG: hypothetical protein LBJ15_16645 [Comamonas sp.]|jgi:hypothetical protein|uniref:hypothetical protein n=1 Tax=Comamonas sp. TaxID=34028 RepID=UPI00281F3D9D|nr:hypothetical protein [Comamonas sp.]MDR0215611.1 hypothetical protein [Comamonas sp.]
MLQRIEALVGIPYDPRRMDCADLAMLVQQQVFGRPVQLAGRRPRPLDSAAQAREIAAMSAQLADLMLHPQDGDAVLMREVGAAEAGHIGTYFFINYTPYVLHVAAWMQGGSTLHRLQELSGLGLTVEGYYRWK